MGPRIGGGPFRLQVWRRTDEESFERVHAGDGPARSEVLGAYLIVVDEGRKLGLADDPEGERQWLTAEESERAAKEKAQADAQREREGKERALVGLRRERVDKEQAIAERDALLRAWRAHASSPPPP